MMSKEWRPDNWTYGAYPPDDDTFGGEAEAFEAGADAILQALFKEVCNNKLQLSKADDGHISVVVLGGKI